MAGLAGMCRVAQFVAYAVELALQRLSVEGVRIDD
jgi:hypothetical protein